MQSLSCHSSPYKQFRDSREVVIGRVEQNDFNCEDSTKMLSPSEYKQTTTKRAFMQNPTSHYRQPYLVDWSMRRDEKLDIDIVIQGSYITDNELTSVLSSSFIISTGVRHLTQLTVKMVFTLDNTNTYMNVI